MTPPAPDKSCDRIRAVMVDHLIQFAGPTFGKGNFALPGLGIQQEMWPPRAQNAVQRYVKSIMAIAEAGQRRADLPGSMIGAISRDNAFFVSLAPRILIVAGEFSSRLHSL